MMPLTAETPKPLLKIMGKPLLVHVLEALPKEVTEVILVVGYKSEMIKEYFGSEFEGRKITYVQQQEQLGTGDALWSCRSYLEPGERFFIVYADDLRDGKAFARALRKNERAMFVTRVDNPKRFGIVETDGDRRVISFEEAPENPKSDLAWTGALLIDADVFDYPPEVDSKHGEKIIQTMVVPYMRDHEVFAEEVDFWLPIGFPEDLKKAEDILKASNG